MPFTIASAQVSDAEFVRAVENCALPLASFRHGDHLRLAWWYLHHQPFDLALSSICSAIMRLAAHNGVPHVFHETRTTAWVTLLNTHDEETFGAFLRQNEHRLSPTLLHEFWSPAVLESNAARTGWVQPDRAPLPH